MRTQKQPTNQPRPTHTHAQAQAQTQKRVKKNRNVRVVRWSDVWRFSACFILLFCCCSCRAVRAVMNFTYPCHRSNDQAALSAGNWFHAGCPFLATTSGRCGQVRWGCVRSAMLLCSRRWRCGVRVFMYCMMIASVPHALWTIYMPMLSVELRTQKADNGPGFVRVYNSYKIFLLHETWAEMGKVTALRSM
jgi:hypothetical protein